MPRLKDTTRAARQEHILRAAVACFARQGYHGATMEDIAAEADIAKGAAYVYFAGKEELFLALYDAWDCTQQEEVTAALAALAPADRASPRRRLWVAMATTGRHVQADPAACRVLMEARTLAPFVPAIATRVRAGEAQAQAQLEELVRAGAAAGEWPPQTDVALQARLLRAALHGLMAQWHSVPGSFDWDVAGAGRRAHERRVSGRARGSRRRAGRASQAGKEPHHAQGEEERTGGSAPTSAGPCGHPPDHSAFLAWCARAERGHDAL